MDKRQKRYFLNEEEIPTKWYNIQADMPNKPAPMISPETGQPLTVEELSKLPQILSSKMIQMIEQQQSLPLDIRLFPHPHPEDKFPIGYLQIFFTPYHMP